MFLVPAFFRRSYLLSISTHSPLRVFTTLVTSVMIGSSSLSITAAMKCGAIGEYTLNSTFLGSTRTILSSLGCFLYNREVIMALRPTDLPCPVAPATRRCGILARSIMNTSLVMVFPRAIGSSICDSWNFFELRMLSIDTMLAFAFGTSIPMVPFPGIGAIIRIPNAATLNAMSSSRFLILDILTPCAGVIS